MTLIELSPWVNSGIAPRSSLGTAVVSGHSDDKSNYRPCLARNNEKDCKSWSE